MDRVVRVLVIDDSAYVRKVVKQMLSRSPFIEVVGAARDGNEGLELRICGWNHWLENHSGLSADEVFGRKLLEVYPDLIERRLDQYYKDALSGQVKIVAQRLHRY